MHRCSATETPSGSFGNKAKRRESDSSFRCSYSIRKSKHSHVLIFNTANSLTVNVCKHAQSNKVGRTWDIKTVLIRAQKPRLRSDKSKRKGNYVAHLRTSSNVSVRKGLERTTSKNCSFSFQGRRSIALLCLT